MGENIVMISTVYLVSIIVMALKILSGLLAGCFTVYFTLHAIEKQMIKKYAVMATVFVTIFLAFPTRHEIVTYLILTRLDSYIQEHGVEMMNPDALISSSLSIEKSIAELEKESSRILGGKPIGPSR